MLLMCDYLFYNTQFIYFHKLINLSKTYTYIILYASSRQYVFLFTSLFSLYAYVIFIFVPLCACVWYVVSLVLMAIRCRLGTIDRHSTGERSYIFPRTTSTLMPVFVNCECFLTTRTYFSSFKQCSFLDICIAIFCRVTQILYTYYIS